MPARDKYFNEAGFGQQCVDSNNLIEGHRILLPRPYCGPVHKRHGLVCSPYRVIPLCGYLVSAGNDQGKSSSNEAERMVHGGFLHEDST